MFRNLFRKWCWSGIDGTHFADVGPPKLVNTLSCLMFLCLLCQLPLLVVLTTEWLSLKLGLLAAACLGVSSVPWLSARRHSSLARNVLLWVYALYFVFASQLWHGETHLHLFLLLGVLMCPFMFPWFEGRSALTAVLVMFCLYLLLLQHGYLTTGVPHTETSLVRYVNQAMLGISVLCCSYYLHFNQKAGWRKVGGELRDTQNTLARVLPSALIPLLRNPAEDNPSTHIASASVMFADMTGFTVFCQTSTEGQVVGFLDEVYKAFDEVCHSLGVEKIKTNGDEYMAVAGIQNTGFSAQRCCTLALQLQSVFSDVCQRYQTDMSLRVGVASGPLVAGVVGVRRFQFDVWGHTVNLAARLETLSVPGTVRVCEHTASAITPFMRVQACPVSILNGIGETKSYQLATNRHFSVRAC